MNGAIFFFPMSPVFHFILIIDGFLSERNVALETILLPCIKVIDLVVVG